MAKLTTEVRWEVGQDSAKSQVLDVAPFRQRHVFLEHVWAKFTEFGG